MKPPHFDLGFFIGRFQPFHYGHWHVVETALESCERLVIIVGSDSPERSLKNPFLMAERLQLITNNMQHFLKEDANRVILKPMADFVEDEDWVEAVSQTVLSVAQPDDTIALVGHDKDDSTYYLKYFPKWGFVDIPNYQNVNATEIREAFFARTLFDSPELLKHVTPESLAFLELFYGTGEFEVLRSGS